MRKGLEYMAYMITLSAMKVESENTTRMMRDGVRNASRDCQMEVTKGFFSDEPELFLSTDVA